MNPFPGYILNGKTYTTVHGLSRAIFKTHANCCEHSMVTREHKVLVFDKAGDVAATYSVEPPVFGKPQHLTLD